MKLTNADIQEIVQLLDASKYVELQLQTERFKLTLRRNADGAGWSQESQIVSAPNNIQGVVSDPGSSTASKAGDASVQRADLLEIRAHLPGTFYRSPKPGAPPFVEVGVRVQPDTVVAIIETMKLMNAVHAGAHGAIAEICCENAQSIAQGAVVMRLKPESS